MISLTKSFSAKLGGVTGISSYEAKIENRLSNLREYFFNRNIVEKMLSSGENPIIYEVYEKPQEPCEGTFSVGCTILYSGKIGDEYYLTKGHFHRKEPRSEIYIGMEGEGMILMQDYEGNATFLEIKPNVLVYNPPKTAHRSINTGKSRLVFLAIYQSDASHDYESIRTKGFRKLVVEKDGKPIVMENPNWKLI